MDAKEERIKKETISQCRKQKEATCRYSGTGLFISRVEVFDAERLPRGFPAHAGPREATKMDSLCADEDLDRTSSRGFF